MEKKDGKTTAKRAVRKKTTSSKTTERHIKLVMLAQSVKSSMRRLRYILNDYDMKDGELFSIIKSLETEATEALKK